MQRSGDELKLVYPQAELDPAALEALDFTHFLLSPWTGPRKTRTISRGHRLLQGPSRLALELQTHKLLGIR